MGEAALKMKEQVETGSKTANQNNEDKTNYNSLMN